MSSDFAVVIPARYSSVRLPGKPLADLHGRPMIQWVHERALASGAGEVIVATDDERIVDACSRFGARAELTRVEHESGTDRIAEIATRFGWADERIVVNVQGDEPQLPPRLVSQVAGLLETDIDAEMATLVTPILSSEEWEDPNIVKVVTDRNGHALYFSRAPIPWPRDDRPPAGLRHIGIYAYRVRALEALARTPPCALEVTERLEQLRALWLGFSIRVDTACEPPPRGIDTQQDLDGLRRELQKPVDTDG